MARCYKPLPGHAFHFKSDAELRFVIKDADEAGRNAHGMGDTVAMCKYLDQVNDACTILHYREQRARG